MSLADRLREVKENAKPPFELWVNALEEEDRDEWFATVADKRVPTAQLVQIVREHGGAIGKDAMLTYRRANGFPG